ncbi:hypothetical protein BJ742DRAFT_739553 [Cladochytrium replicatum]|nr:hypothetical protein BJ742DRAFT_739553 [Cladochytrium replicatum]
MASLIIERGFDFGDLYHHQCTTARWTVCNTFGGDYLVIRETPSSRFWARNPEVPFSEQPRTRLGHRTGATVESENVPPPALEIPDGKGIIEVWAGEYQLAQLVASTWVE